MVLKMKNSFLNSLPPLLMKQIRLRTLQRPKANVNYGKYTGRAWQHQPSSVMFSSEAIKTWILQKVGDHLQGNCRWRRLGSLFKITCTN